jgi:hypothetical protein
MKLRWGSVCNVTLGVMLLMAVRNPSAHRSVIAFAAWSSFAHASVMATMVACDSSSRGEFPGVEETLHVLACQEPLLTTQRVRRNRSKDMIRAAWDDFRVLVERSGSAVTMTNRSMARYWS